ncbi:MAG TPA: hypothetical protein VF534_01215 [Paraburkholderia sp.]
MTAPAGVFPTGTPNVAASGTLQNINDAVTLNTDTMGSVDFALAGTPVGATVTFEQQSDGATWISATAYQKGVTPRPQGASTATVAGVYNITVGGAQKVRARLSAITSGSFTASANGTVGAAHVGVKNGNAADLNATVVSAGTVGTDYSVNKPTIPNVGAVFGNSGPYANYVLIQTVPASPTRNNVDIENTSGGQIVVVRDDGTAATGAAPTNASVFPLGGGASVGAQGGSWSSQTFKGRLQIYAPASTAIVAVMVD